MIRTCVQRIRPYFSFVFVCLYGLYFNKTLTIIEKSTLKSIRDLNSRIISISLKYVIDFGNLPEDLHASSQANGYIKNELIKNYFANLQKHKN
jgi:hypothetical protein